VTTAGSTRIPARGRGPRAQASRPLIRVGTVSHPIEDILEAAQLQVAPSSAFDPARILSYIRKKTADARNI